METGEILHRFYARDYHEAMGELAWWKQQNPELDLKYGRDDDEPAQTPQFQEPSSGRGDLTPRGPGPWEIYRISDGRSVRELRDTNRTGAEAEARAALGLRGEAPELFAVRTRAQPIQPGDIVAPGLGEVPAVPRTWYVSVIGQPDTEIEIRSAANAEDATRQAQVARPGLFAAETGNIRAAHVPVTTTPAAGTGEFTGEWKIVAPDGTEVHRFGGVGNVQADANRVAMAWLQRNPRHMVDGTEVVPVMSE